MKKRPPPFTFSKGGGRFFQVLEILNLMTLDRRQEYFSKMHRQYGGQYDYFEFHYEVENIRIARSEQRDLYFEFHYEVENIRIARSEQRDLL